MMQKFVIVMALIATITACKKNEATNSGLDARAIPLSDSSLMDLSYGADKQQRMDLYLPANRTKNTPLIILIHGGGWSTGDKRDFSFYITELQRRLPGYALANLNYRLVKGNLNKFPAQENDVLSAVTFLQRQSESFVFSPSQMIYIGSSAGAHLALLQGYKHADVVRPKGIISFFGPVDMTALYARAVHSSLSYVLEAVTGYTPQENLSAYHDSSPIFFTTAESSPTLIFHGGRDNLVPVEQAESLHARLDSLHVINQLVVYPDEGHGWTGDNLTDSFNKIQDFIQKL